MENKCDLCIHNKVCDHNRFGFENCEYFKAVSCEAKKQYQKAYEKQKYDERKANHQCIDCGCELEAGSKMVRCKTCRQIASYNSNKFYQSRKEKGLCRVCSKPLAEGTKFLACDECRKILREKQRGIKSGNR